MHTTTLILGLYLVWIKLFNIIIYHKVACNWTCQKLTTSNLNLTRDEINRFNIKITTLEYTTSRIVENKTCSPYLPRAWISAPILALACASNRLWHTWVEKMFGIKWKVCSICIDKLSSQLVEFKIYLILKFTFLRMFWYASSVRKSYSLRSSLMRSAYVSPSRPRNDMSKSWSSSKSLSSSALRETVSSPVRKASTLIFRVSGCRNCQRSTKILHKINHWTYQSTFACESVEKINIFVVCPVLRVIFQTVKNSFYVWTPVIIKLKANSLTIEKILPGLRLFGHRQNPAPPVSWTCGPRRLSCGNAF